MILKNYKCIKQLFMKVAGFSHYQLLISVKTWNCFECSDHFSGLYYVAVSSRTGRGAPQLQW